MSALPRPQRCSERIAKRTRSCNGVHTAPTKKLCSAAAAPARSASTNIIMNHLVRLICTTYSKRRAIAAKRRVLLVWREAEGRADEVEDAYSSAVAKIQAEIDHEFDIVDKLCDDYEAVRDKGYYHHYTAVLDQLQDNIFLKAGSDRCSFWQHLQKRQLCPEEIERFRTSMPDDFDRVWQKFSESRTEQDAIKQRRQAIHRLFHRQHLHQITEEWTIASRKLQAVQRRATAAHTASEAEMLRLEDVRQDCADQWSVLKGRECDLELDEFALIVQMAIFRKEQQTML